MTSLTPAKALKLLRDAGHRITDARESIVTLLLRSKTPLSAADVLERLKKTGTRVNRVTVYRELSFLEKERIVESVQFQDGIKRYSRADGHRHHLICTECRRVEQVELPHDLDTVEKRISRKTAFTILRHELEFYGHCRRCA